MISRQFFDQILYCPITYYIIEVSLAVFFVPYLLRAYRTIMVYYMNVAKSKRGGKKKGKKGEKEEKELEPKEGEEKKENEGEEKNENGEEKEKKKVSTPFIVKYRNFHSELFLLLVLVFFTIAWFILGIIVQIISWLAIKFWDPLCPKQVNFKTKKVYIE
jgi:hypothetical protein